MPELLELPTPTLDRYDNEADLTASLERKGTADPGDGLYPRDGTAEVTEVESALSELTIPGQERNVVVASGMAAVGGAVRFSLQLKGREGVDRPVLAYPPHLYTQSTRTFESLRYMGVAAAGYDPGDPDSVESLFDGERKADVVFAETVSNTPGMPVLDIHRLLARTREAGKDAPLVVLDNTLPLSTGIDFDEILDEDDRVLVVESATKGPLHNSGHLGVVYSAHEELMGDFRKYKITEGLVTSTGIEPSLLEALAATTPGFDERNRALYESTRIIARYAAEAQAAQGGQPEITVAHPELEDHPNYEYVQEHMPNGVSPVVFLDLADWTNENVGREFLGRLTEQPAIREQIKQRQVFLGQSFGFKEATLLYDPRSTQIRIAGGYDIDSHALGKALYSTLVGSLVSPLKELAV